MKVYLDNNVLIDIEEGILSHEQFISVRDSEYYYSAAHIDELIEGQDNPRIDVRSRLALIETITKNNHILNGFTSPEFYSKSVADMYELSNRKIQIGARKTINTLSSSLNVNRDEFLDLLKINRLEVNNVPSSKILNTISEAMEDTIGISVESYLKVTESIGRSVYVTLFNLLDFACFHKDKPSDHSNIARMHDASHAYYAQLCDILVSQDKKMRYKSEAVYAYLGVKTKVMGIREYLEFTNGD